MNNKLEMDKVPIKAIPCNDRINRLSEHFYKEFNNKPLFFVRVPGRVNIIGEHIDYCGYPVLPMALEQDILIAVGLINEFKLQLRNMNSKYDNLESLDIKSSEDILIEPDFDGKPFWYNYILCGVKGGLEFLNNNIKNGLQLDVDGNIPPASGLSSSSALVSAACLAFLYAQDARLSKTEIASICAKCERYIGTQGGGMDQAIAFLAEKYTAQYITWDPLNATPVVLPENATFVVAHSLAEANKAATNDFNRRVTECRLAAKILAMSAGATFDKNIITLSKVQKCLDNSLEDMVNLVNKYLQKDIYTKREVCEILNISEEEINQTLLTSNTIQITEFKLKQRALHVYEEAMRVEEFRKICSQAMSEQNNKSKSPLSNGNNGDIVYENGTDNILDILGNLMSGSHESLRNLYECSHDNLDCLVNISKKMNIHSRLTGAGWGGCIVALCPREKTDEYIEMLVEEFYSKYCNVDKVKARSLVFATTPNHGAVIYVNK